MVSDPEGIFQIFAVRSSLPVRIKLPVGLTCTLLMSLRCPVIFVTSFPVLAFQTKHSLYIDETKYFPSLLKEAEPYLSLFPSIGLIFSPVSTFHIKIVS